MKALYYILGILLLIAGTGGGVYIIVAVASKAQGFTTLTEMIPALVFHTVAMFLGMVFVSLGMRYQKSA